MEQKVRELIEKPLENINIKLCSVSYVKDGNTNFLRIVIDKKPFVDVDTCVSATNVINPIIDKLESLFDDSYVLDVCSLEKEGNNNE